MVAEHGGYRKPENPAPVSGPGKQSKRTDGGPSQKLMVAPAQNYGDGVATKLQEQGAPMSQGDNVTPANIPNAQPGNNTAAAPSQPFNGPTANPGEPVTHGVDIGLGGGSDVLPQQAQPQFQQQGPLTTMLSDLSARDQSGVLARLFQAAQAAGA